jgi:branched-chain amino acid transport system permease protein
MGKAKELLKKNWIVKLISLAALYIIVKVFISVGIIDSYLQATLTTICINIILAASLNLITGFTGQFSLGHAGFMSIGAYACALTTLRMSTTSGFLIGTLIGAVAASIIGFLVGLPTLRLKGDYLAIATLGLSEIIKVIFINMDKVTNGAAGLSFIPRLVNWNWLFIYTVCVLLLITNFIKSTHGRACIAIREDEIAAEAMGIHSTKYKVTAFTIGAFCAGIAGAMYSSFFSYIDPNLFGFAKSIDVLVIVVFGGLGSTSGSVLAAIVLALISTYLSTFSELRMVLYALLLIIIMLFRPQGLLGTRELSLSMFRRAGRMFSSKKERV